MQAMARATTSTEDRSGSPMRSSAKGKMASVNAATMSGTRSLRIAVYSNFSMRSPNSPRGRVSNTSAISKYMEASPQEGLK